MKLGGPLKGAGGSWMSGTAPAGSGLHYHAPLPDINLYLWYIFHLNKSHIPQENHVHVGYSTQTENVNHIPLVCVGARIGLVCITLPVLCQVSRFWDSHLVRKGFLDTNILVSVRLNACAGG